MKSTLTVQQVFDYARTSTGMAKLRKAGVTGRLTLDGLRRANPGVVFAKAAEAASGGLKTARKVAAPVAKPKTAARAKAAAKPAKPAAKPTAKPAKASSLRIAEGARRALGGRAIDTAVADEKRPTFRQAMESAMKAKVKAARLPGVVYVNYTLKRDAVSVSTEHLHHWAHYGEFRDAVAKAFGVSAERITGGRVKPGKATSPNVPQRADYSRPSYYTCEFTPVHGKEYRDLKARYA